MLSLLLLLSAAVPLVNADAADAGGKWTVMIYMAGGVDQNINKGIERDLGEIERAGYNPDFNILILKDGDKYGDSSLLRFEMDGFSASSPDVVNSTWHSEVDMSKWETLRDFVSWGLNNYPATHTMLIFWGHGEGWMGMPADEGYNKVLDFQGVSKALSPVVKNHGKLDIIGFDQCNMAMFEVFYAIAPFADYAVASEKEEDLWGWPYDLILPDMYGMDEPTPSNVSRVIVEDDVSWARNDSNYSATMSAINLSRMPMVVNALKNYTIILKKFLPNYKLEITVAGNDAEKYDKEPYPYDLYNLTENLEKEIKFPILSIAGRELREAINEAVIAERHYKNPNDMKVSGAHGIGIWFSTPGSTAGTYNGYDGLEGANKTDWAEFLELYYHSVPGKKIPLYPVVTEMDRDGDGANESFSVRVSGNWTFNIEVLSGDDILRRTSSDSFASLNFYPQTPGYYDVVVYSSRDDSINNYTVVKGTIETYVKIGGRISDSSGNPINARLIFHFRDRNMSLDADGYYYLEVKAPYGVSFGEKIPVTIEYCGEKRTDYVWVNSTYIHADFSAGWGESMVFPYILALLMIVLSVFGVFWIYDKEERQKRMERLKSEVKIGSVRKVKKFKKVIKLRTFVDREEELAELSTALKSATDGVGSSIFLTGEEGVGKRSLINRFRKESNSRFISYEASGGEKKPYEGVIRVLESMNSMGISSINAGDILSRASKEQGFEESFQAFAEASAEEPLIVYFSSAQWLDHGSIEFLEYLARGIDETKVVLIISAPQEELEDTNGKPHPLNAMLMSLIMEGKIRMLKLERFDRDTAGAMLSILLDAEINGELLDKIYEKTQGLPLMIEEIANRLRTSRKSLYEIEESDIELPRNVRELIGKRLEKLDKEERAVAEWAAVLGTGFSLELIKELSDEEEGLEDIVYRLIEDKILVEEGGEYRLDHPQLREILCDELAERASEMHLKAGDVMEKIGSGDVYILAHHFCFAGLREKCLEYSIRAAEKAERSYAPRDAVKYYQMAEKNAEGNMLPKIYLNIVKNLRKILEIESAEEYAKKASAAGGEIADRAHLLLGHIYLESSRWGEAEKEYKKALSSDIGEVVIDAYRGIGKVYWRLGEHKKAAEYLQKAIDLAQKAGNSGILGTATIDLANVYSDWGKYPKAIELYQLAIKILESVSSISEIGRAYNNMGEIYKYKGDLEKAAECYLNCIEYAQSAKDSLTMGYGIENLGTIYTYMGKFEEASEYLSKAYRIFSKSGDKYMISGIYMAYGIMYRMQKKWAKSEENLLKSMELLKEIGIKYDLGISIYEYGRMLKEKGDERAEKILKEALSIFREIGSKHHIEVVEKELELEDIGG